LANWPFLAALANRPVGETAVGEPANFDVVGELAFFSCVGEPASWRTDWAPYDATDDDFTKWVAAMIARYYIY
jgi:hypothetical protein